MKTKLSFLILVLLFLLFSCEKESVVVNEVVAVLQENLNVQVRATVKDKDGVKLKITDPSGFLVWEVKGIETIYNNDTYYGYSNISLPPGASFADGKWKLDFIYKDGTVVERYFEIIK